MNRLARTLFTIMIAVLPPWLSAASIEQIPDFSARYTVNKADLNIISLTITLERGPGKIEYRSAAEPIGIASWFFGDHRIHEYSGLKQVAGNIVPLEYKYTHKGSDENENEQYIYDWRRNIAHVNYRGEARTFKIPDGTLDNFSLQLALMLDACAGQKEIAHPLISKGELKTYTFTNLGRETIETPLGIFESIKLERRKDDEENTTYTTWYAPELHYLPVKFENREDGDVELSIILEEVKWQN